MNYGSSYAAGMQAGHHDPSLPAMGMATAQVILPPPPPRKVHVSTMVFAIGMAICSFGLLLAIAGVPGRVLYDANEEGVRNKPDSMDPLAIQKSLDANMKWIDKNSSGAPGGYLGYIESINKNEAAIPVMVQALVAMDASVRTIDGGLAVVNETTQSMQADMEAMTAASQKSADTMTAMSADLGFLSKTMLGLANSTRQLTTKMAAIEEKAGNISTEGTAKALATTKELNAALPDGVPEPVLERSGQ